MADAVFDAARYRTSEARGIFNESRRFSAWADWAARFRSALTTYNKATAHLSYHEEGAEYKAALAIGRENIESAVHILIDNFQEWGWLAPLLLRNLTGADPIRREHAGRFNRIAADWINWSEDLQALSGDPQVK